jgi:hypothetical protein
MQGKTRQKAIDELLANRAEIDLQLALLDFQESEKRRQAKREQGTPLRPVAAIRNRAE